jgi:hypothetical protein
LPKKAHPILLERLFMFAGDALGRNRFEWFARIAHGKEGDHEDEAHDHQCPEHPPYHET